MSRVPRVSVIVTCYKRTHYIAEALRSILDQSYRNYEIVVSDDSGTAAVQGIVAAFEQPERIRYLAHPRTLGVASSIVAAVNHARGEFIAVLNDDDSWEPHLLDKLVSALDADARCVLATSDHWIMDANGDIDRELSESWSVNCGRSGLSEGVISNPAQFVVNGGPAINITSVFRRAAVDWSLLVPDIAGAYDYWIGCWLAATRRPIYYTPERLGRWRVHASMETTRRAHDKNESSVYIYSMLLKHDFFSDLTPLLKARIAEALFAKGRDKLDFGRVRDARTAFWRCFCLAGSPQAFIRLLATFLPGPLRNRVRRIPALVRATIGFQQNRKREVYQPFAGQLPAADHQRSTAE